MSLVCETSLVDNVKITAKKNLDPKILKVTNKPLGGFFGSKMFATSISTKLINDVLTSWDMNFLRKQIQFFGSFYFKKNGN